MNMVLRTAVAMSLLTLFLGAQNSSNKASKASKTYTPEYNEKGELLGNADYRQWVFLSSGMDMSYSPNAMPGHSTFDNVFVNPEAYQKFLKTGTWPDKTVLVLEVREAGSKASINKSGHFQTGEVEGLEVHVKDEARFPGKWAFFGFGEGDTGKLIPQTASCYSCHQEHAAVDTTFVQFYPTLLKLAQEKGTLSSNYQKEEKSK
jgi:cytochrome P460